MPIVDRFDRWHIDFLGPLPESPEGFKYILLITDSFSRWCEAFPTKTQEAKTVADILYKEIFTRYGAPRTLVSDQGRQFLSYVVRALCEMFKVKKVNTSPYHPQTNSTCERFNSFLEQSLRVYCGKDQAQWPKYIPGILMAYRSTPSTWSTTFSPYYLLFGKEMVTPLDCELLTPAVMATAKQYVEELTTNLQMAQTIAKENVAHNSANNKTYHEKRAKDTTYKLGQLVLLRQEHVKTGESSKLHPPYRGPFYITNIGPPPTYKLRDAKSHKQLTSYVHGNRLKPYFAPDDRQYANKDVKDQPVQDLATDLVHPADTPPATNPPPASPSPDSQSPDDQSNEDSDKQVEVVKIIKAGTAQNRKAYMVNLLNRSGSIWLYAEDVPEALKRNFHINKTQAGKKRKRHKKTS